MASRAHTVHIISYLPSIKGTYSTYNIIPPKDIWHQGHIHIISYPPGIYALTVHIYIIIPTKDIRHIQCTVHVILYPPSPLQGEEGMLCFGKQNPNQGSMGQSTVMLFKFPITKDTPRDFCQVVHVIFVTLSVRVRVLLERATVGPLKSFCSVCVER